MNLKSLGILNHVTLNQCHRLQTLSTAELQNDTKHGPIKLYIDKNVLKYNYDHFLFKT